MLFMYYLVLMAYLLKWQEENLSKNIYSLFYKAWYGF